MQESVVLSCPPPSAGGLAGEIRARGNVPMLFGPDCLIELSKSDIRETWAASGKLPKAEIMRLAHSLESRLIADGPEDREDLAGEAMAYLFLTLRREGAHLKRALCGCAIRQDSEGPHLEYLI